MEEALEVRDDAAIVDNKSERSELRKSLASEAHSGAIEKGNTSNEANISLSKSALEVATEGIHKDIKVPLYLRKELLKLAFPLSTGVNFGVHKINPDIISYKLVGNWEDLNKGLIEHKIECSVCYSLIFWHESLEDRMSPLAY